jgi:hypothetical protein
MTFSGFGRGLFIKKTGTVQKNSFWTTSQPQFIEKIEMPLIYEVELVQL